MIHSYCAPASGSLACHKRCKVMRRIDSCTSVLGGVCPSPHESLLSFAETKDWKIDIAIAHWIQNVWEFRRILFFSPSHWKTRTHRAWSFALLAHTQNDGSSPLHSQSQELSVHSSSFGGEVNKMPLCVAFLTCCEAASALLRGKKSWKLGASILYITPSTCNIPLLTSKQLAASWML